jgi:phosphoserine aminotransferase
MNNPEWTTRKPPELTRPYGVEELHTVCFVPKGWKGKGTTVSLGIPESKTNLDTGYWTRFACKEAVQYQACIMFQCDTAAQSSRAAKRATRWLPGYQRMALERMYDPISRVVDNLS